MKAPSKRDEILQAALEIIAERGFHGAPMAMIADRAKVGAGTIYRYFETKDVLIRELFEQRDANLRTVIREGYPADRPLRERFFHLWKTLFRYMIANPLDFRFLEQYHNSPYGAALHRDRLLNKADEEDTIRYLFEEGTAQQVMKDLPLLVLFSLSFGPLMSLIQDHIQGLLVMDDALVGKTMEACWNALKR
jgi:AcrR family transcriptional regulator